MRLDLEQIATKILAATATEYRHVPKEELAEALVESFVEVSYGTLRRCNAAASALNVDEMRARIMPEVQQAHAR